MPKTTALPSITLIPTRMRPLVVAAQVALAATGLGACAANDRAPNLDAYYHQHVTWTDCRQGSDDELGRSLHHAGARCAHVTVPLDYTRPDGRTIKLAVSRLPAADPDRRIGALMLNNGGPGQPTLGMPLQTRTHMGAAAARYDLIGMDPRFVGRSEPLDCHWPSGMWIRSAGHDRAAFDRQTAFQKDLAERCRRTSGDVLPYATTRNTARDMDIVRAVLGERRISYLGYSYGGYLGAVYLQLFPGRTDRVILDSPVDPGSAGPRMLRDTEAASERAMRAWASWAAARNDDYGLGRTRDQVLATLQRTGTAASDKPLHVGTYDIDEHVLPYVVYLGVGNDHAAARAAFSATVRTLDQAARRKAVTPPEELRETLRFLLDRTSSHEVSPAAAILCGDRAAPRDPDTYWRDVQRSRSRHTLFGPLADNVNPCAFWPESPREAPTKIDNRTPALVVSATGDTATTYQGGQATHHALSRSRLLTLDGAIGHGVYGEYGNACVDTKVNAYLTSGKLPTHNESCHA